MTSSLAYSFHNGGAKQARAMTWACATSHTSSRPGLDLYSPGLIPPLGAVQGCVPVTKQAGISICTAPGILYSVLKISCLYTAIRLVKH